MQSEQRIWIFLVKMMHNDAKKYEKNQLNTMKLEYVDHRCYKNSEFYNEINSRQFFGLILTFSY